MSGSSNQLFWVSRGAVNQAQGDSKLKKNAKSKSMGTNSGSPPHTRGKKKGNDNQTQQKLIAGRIKDLCVADRQKIANLILRVAQVEAEKKECETKMRGKLEMAIGETESLKQTYRVALERMEGMKRQMFAMMQSARKTREAMMRLKEAERRKKKPSMGKEKEEEEEEEGMVRGRDKEKGNNPIGEFDEYKSKDSVCKQGKTPTEDKREEGSFEEQFGMGFNEQQERQMLSTISRLVEDHDFDFDIDDKESSVSFSSSSSSSSSSSPSPSPAVSPSSFSSFRKGKRTTSHSPSRSNNISTLSLSPPKKSLSPERNVFDSFTSNSSSLSPLTSSKGSPSPSARRSVMPRDDTSRGKKEAFFAPSRPVKTTNAATEAPAPYYRHHHRQQQQHLFSSYTAPLPPSRPSSSSSSYRVSRHSPPRPVQQKLHQRRPQNEVSTAADLVDIVNSMERGRPGEEGEWANNNSRESASLFQIQVDRDTLSIAANLNDTHRSHHKHHYHYPYQQEHPKSPNGSGGADLWMRGSKTGVEDEEELGGLTRKTGKAKFLSQLGPSSTSLHHSPPSPLPHSLYRGSKWRKLQ
eukprot:Nk52_evm13s2377 gene=Nk52_evmTU13s2377